MKNRSLNSFIKKNQEKRDPRFTNTLKYIISYGIAKPMEYLHKQDRIHRDLKAGNVLLDDNLHPLLTDFGTAKKIDHSISIHQTLESTTPAIMSPEFIENPQKYSNYPPIDVYAYGMTIYELWAENAPFSHIKSSFVVMNVITSGQRPSIPKSVPDIWKKLIEACWEHNPKDRPTFSEIVEALDTDKYYTKDMNVEEIEKYKNFLSPSEKVDSNRPSQIEEDSSKDEEHEEEQDDTEIDTETEENPALTKMREDAEAGDFISQFNYVIAMFEGTYGKTDIDEAEKYSIRYIRREGAFNKESIADSSTMEFYAGKCFATKGEYEKADKILRQSINHGNGEASFYLAELMYNGHVRPKTSAEFEHFYQIAADSGIQEAVKKYAYMLLYGAFDPLKNPDKKKAISYFMLGSDQGDPEMMYMWAIRNEFGRDIPQDIPKAMVLMKLSADKGYPTAMVDYGIHLLNGINVPKNVNEAKARFQQAASQNDPWGQLWYYLMAKDDDPNDETIKENLSKSLESYQCPEAWGVYGRELVESGEEENINLGIQLLVYAASCGSMNAFLCLGDISENDPSKGDSNYYYEIASNYCHCVGECD